MYTPILAEVPGYMCALARLFSQAYSHQVATAELQQVRTQDEPLWTLLYLVFFH